jgi:phage gp16-like protein
MEILESYSPVDGQLIAKVKTSQRQTTKSNGVRYRSFQNIQIDAGTATW